MAKSTDSKPVAAKQGKRKAAKRVFSATKAVKANARERLGAPPPGRVIADEKSKAGRPRHTPTLGELLLPE